MARNETTLTNGRQDWKATFTYDEFDTDKASSLFLQRILYVFTSTVLKYRKILPSEAFKSRRISDVESYGHSTFAVLKSIPGNKVTERVSKLLKSSGEAIEQRYLRSFALVISENDADPNVVTEAFLATFVYGNQDVLKIQDSFGRTLAELSYRGPDTVKHQTLYLIDKIRTICHHMNGLPANYKPSFRLSYYDDRTPRNYEPDGFYRANNNFRFEARCAKMECARVDTKIYAGVFEIQSVYFDEEDEESLEDKVENTLQQFITERKRRSLNTSLNESVMNSSFAPTPIARSRKDNAAENEQQTEQARHELSTISISSSSPKPADLVQLTEPEMAGEETSDDATIHPGRKRRSAPAARRLEFKAPSPPKKTRIISTRSQAKKQASVTEESGKSTTSSGSTSEAMDEEVRDKPVIVKSPPMAQTSFEKYSERYIMENTPPSHG